MCGCRKCNDIYKEPCEQLNYLDVNYNCEDLRKFVDDIRAEVIDEFRNRLFGKLVRLTLSMWHFKLFDDVLQETYNELLEQLKEQK